MGALRLAAATALVASLIVAVPAHAATVAEVRAAASTMLDDCELLEARFIADLEPHSVLKADHAALEVDRAVLLVERGSLPDPCDCADIDADLAAIADISDSLAATIGDWEEGN